MACMIETLTPPEQIVKVIDIRISTIKERRIVGSGRGKGNQMKNKQMRRDNKINRKNNCSFFGLAKYIVSDGKKSKNSPGTN